MNIEFLNPLKPPYERDQGRKKKNRGDEPIQAIIHINMEVPQGNSMFSYIKQAKMSVFFFLLQNWKTGRQNVSFLTRGSWYQWEGRGGAEREWEGKYTTNTVYTYINGKMRPVESIQERGAGR
jgi:hypothetical protein